MSRILFAAIYGALFSEAGAIAYFTIWISLGRVRNFTDLIMTMLHVAFFALIPATFFGAVLGGLGGWFLPRIASIEKRIHFIGTAAAAGGFLGCVPPILHHFFPPPPVHNPWEPGFLPFVLIGALCAATWALLWRHFSMRTHKTAIT